MFKRAKIIMVSILALATLTVTASGVRAAGNEDKSHAPYFLVRGDDVGADRLPLKSSEAKVNISGVIADVQVTQVYKNEGDKTLEAIYIFPASTRAAVHGMKMTIGERTIHAAIQRRDAARKAYENAKNAGKTASLLEQQRPNVFQMNVANILPSDVIEVKLMYTELLVPTDGVYEFIYPTVVGPRFVEGTEGHNASSDGWTANPYLYQGDMPPYTFDISVNVAAGLSIQEITCPSHKTNITFQGPARATINLDPSEGQGGNRDYILNYRLSGNRIETGLLLFEGEDENYFLMMLQPPRNPAESQIPPREYIFIVDVSGSMNGFPLDISKKLLRDLIGNLGPKDRFNVLLFAGGSHLLSPHSMPATHKNLLHAVRVIEKERGGGGTRLLPALKRALSLPKTAGFSRSIVIATDGYVSVEEEAFDLIRNNLGDANMFTFGIGSSVNRHLIEGMARVGMGEPMVITRPEEAPHMADRFRKLIQVPVLTGVQVHFDQFDISEVAPPAVPDVLSDRPVIVFGKWRGRPKGTIIIRGVSGDRSFEKTLDVSRFKPAGGNGALRYLWARYRITLLSDYNRLRPDDERIKEVTRLGLEHSLLTPYTSFVAIDTRVRLKDGKTVTVKQPLPLPQGVSDLAVGGNGVARKSMAYRSALAAPSPRERPMVEEAGAHGKATDSDLEKKKEPETKERPTMVLHKVNLRGGLSEKSVREVISSNGTALERCIPPTNSKKPGLPFKASFKLEIDANGHVTSATMVHGERNGDFERCMVKTLKKLVFPSSSGKRKTTVTVTFLLK